MSEWIFSQRDSALHLENAIKTNVENLNQNIQLDSEKAKCFEEQIMSLKFNQLDIRFDIQKRKRNEVFVKHISPK